MKKINSTINRHCLKSTGQIYLLFAILKTFGFLLALFIITQMTENRDGNRTLVFQVNNIALVAGSFFPLRAGIRRPEPLLGILRRTIVVLVFVLNTRR